MDVWMLVSVGKMWIVPARKGKLIDLWLVQQAGELLFELYASTSCVDSVSVAWVEVSVCMSVVVCSVECGQQGEKWGERAD